MGYCEPQDLASFLRLINLDTGQRLVFSDDTDPSLAEVSDAISSASSYISQRVGSSCPPKRTEEIKDCALYHYTDIRMRESPVCLLYSPVRPFSLSEGDRVEILSKGEWENLLETGEEGRNKDYWVDYNSGIIYLVKKQPDCEENSVRVCYRYGYENDGIPSELKYACVRLTAIWYAESDFFRVGLPYGENLPDPASRIEKWREEAESVLAGRTAFSVCNL